jgi:alpha-L-fucosidase 2
MHTKLIMRYPSTWHGDMWREAAPCGNGVVGAAVYGGVKSEKILVNHARLWRGSRTAPLPDVSDALPEIRALLAEHKPEEADGVLSRALRERGYDGSIGNPLPLGDLTIESASALPFSHYRRTVDMERAEVVVSWNEGGSRITRRTFVSRASGALMTRIESSGVPLDIAIGFGVHDTETLGGNKLQNVESTASPDGVIRYAGRNDSEYYGGDYGAVCRVDADGALAAEGAKVRVTGAHSVTVTARIFVGSDRAEEFANVPDALDYETELSAHEALHREYFDRASLTISEMADTSNEELLLAAYEDAAPAELIEKLYAYGRYLLICSSDGTMEKGALPCHLIGLWNGTYNCFWAFYMYNINFEMIYWQALSSGIPEYLRVALDYTESFMDDFRENAKKLYGCRGIYINSVNTPESGLSKCGANHILNWTAGAAWFAQHFRDYARFTGDDGYMRDHALPFMAEAAAFYEDFCVEGDDGYLHFNPSVSPENSSVSVRGGAETCSDAAMDAAVLKELLTNLIAESTRLSVYADKIPVWRAMLAKLPPYRVNSDGAAAEWLDPWYADNYHHRHHSHMYPVFPGREIRPGDALADAFAKAAERRRTVGLCDMSSWSSVFASCIDARFGDGDGALFWLDMIAKTCCMNNLYTTHNDWRRMGPVWCDDMRIAPFQIDANIGITAAVNEMLLYGCEDEIILLPALPSAWKKGEARGLCARGRVCVDIEWDGESVRATLRTDRPQKLTLRCGINGSPVEIDLDGETAVTFPQPRA